MEYDYSNFKSLEINQEEVDSIRKYISFMHAKMNAVLDLDPEVLTRLKDKSWTIDLSKENIKEFIEDFKRIYSAMYKYSKKRGPYFSDIYRGTSRNEIDRLQKGSSYGRFLSTSSDEGIARRFVEYGNGAIVSVGIEENIPYLCMDEFLGDTQVSEKEILFAPYSIVESKMAYMVPPEGQSRRYSVSISKAKFKNISDEERRKCEELIYSVDLNEKLEKYSSAQNSLEYAISRISGLTPKDKIDDPDLMEHLKDKREKSSKELWELEKEFSNIKNAMNIYIQDKFKTIEVELEKEIKKEEAIIDEEVRVNKVKELKEKRESLLKKADNVLNFVSDTQYKYFEQDEEEKELNELANTTNTFIEVGNKSEQEIVERFESLSTNIEALKEEIANIQILDDLSMDEMDVKGDLMSQINEKYSQLEMANSLMSECQNCIDLEKGKSKSETDRKISEKIKDSMINKALSDLNEQRNHLISKKDSIIDKITGKAKLKKAQIDNLDLKIKTIDEKGLNIPNNIKGVENYLKKYSQVLGIENLPADARVILKNSLKNVEMPEFTEEDAKEFELYFNPNMPTIANKKLSRKEMINSINEQNQRLSQITNNSIEPEEQKTEFDKKLNRNRDVYNIEDTLDMAITYTSKDGRTLEQKKEELRKNRTVDLFNKFLK